MSLKGDKYETTEEVKLRLENSVVLYDDNPVYISRVQMPELGEKEIARVYFFDLPLVRGSKESRKFLSSRKFDLTPFRMGYMNLENKAVFASRVPIRQNRQGLSAGTFTTYNVDGKVYADKPFEEFIRHKAFTDMIKGKYPDFKQIGNMFDEGDGKESVAVSRNFAFRFDHDLETLVLVHKNIRCGFARKNEKAINIPPKFHFLREEMEEGRIPLA